MSVQHEVFAQVVRTNTEAGNRLFKLFSEAATQSLESMQQFAQNLSAAPAYKAPAAVSALPLNVAGVVSDLHASHMAAFERVLSAQSDAIVDGARGAIGTPTELTEVVAESFRSAFKAGQDSLNTAVQSMTAGVEAVAKPRGRRAA